MRGSNKTSASELNVSEIHAGGVLKKVEINLKKERKYKICTCGSSKTIPFCDDSHRELNEKTDSNYKSLKITPEENIKLNISSKNWKNEN